MTTAYDPFIALVRGDPLPIPDKRLATLRARLAFKGIVLDDIVLDDGSVLYIVRHGYLSKELPDIESLSAWVDMVTGVKA